VRGTGRVGVASRQVFVLLLFACGYERTFSLPLRCVCFASESGHFDNLEIGSRLRLPRGPATDRGVVSDSCGQELGRAMSRDWNERAKYWDRDERVRFYADQAFRYLSEHVNLSDGAWKKKRVFDFGRGTVVLTGKLAPLVGDVIAVDASPDMIGILRKKELTNVSAIFVDIDEDSVRASATWFSDFDLIVASSDCNFLPDYKRSIRHLSQTPKSGGKLV
jgi:hypothetical protein